MTMRNTVTDMPVKGPWSLLQSMLPKYSMHLVRDLDFDLVLDIRLTALLIGTISW